MKKWTKMMTLYSVAVLASASSLTAFADEIVPATTDLPVVTVTPTTNTPAETPSPSDDTAVPTVPTAPTMEEPIDNSGATTVTPPSDDTVIPTKPTDNSTNPSTTPTTEPTAPTTKSTDSNEGKEDKKDEPTTDSETGTTTVPTIDGGTTSLKPDVTVPTNNPNVSAQTAANAGASQIGTTSTVTGQVVSNVSPSAPIYTQTGYQIVSTQNSQVVIAYNDGSTAMVSPEAVGGVVNVDKTISIKTASGEMATLPTTGEKENLFLSLLGVFMLIGTYLFKKKSLKEN